MIKSYTGIKNKAVLQKEEQLYTYLIYLRALFYRNLINTVLMASAVKFGREELCQNHVRFFSADEASRHNQYISVIVLDEPGVRFLHSSRERHEPLGACSASY